MRIALTGNPNSGKTTLYNAITGKKEHAGNWAGVTVSKKQSPLKSEFCDGQERIAVDLPGAYSMSPFTSEESITSSFVKSESPDVIINIVDATNLSRSLFFTTQLLELGIPTVVALNKADSRLEKGINIDVKKLTQLLGCPVVETTATQEKGLADLVKQAVSVAGKVQNPPFSQGNVDLSNKDVVTEADKKRFEFVNTIISKVENRVRKTGEANSNDKLDKIFAHKVAGLGVFALVMWAVFFVSQAVVGPVIADILVGWIEGFGEMVGESLEDASPFLSALIVDGIIGGVGAVVGFLPLVMVMYFLIALLEDCGYMARVAVVMDPYLKKVGLTGKSIIPMVIGTACAIPGVMASRTIRNERERRTTAMLTPFMPCGAKIPVIALFAGVFFEDAAWVSTLMYFSGIMIIIVGARLIQLITGHKNRPSFFIMEMPDYKTPSTKHAFSVMMDRGKAFIVKAGTIILVCNAMVHIMQSFDTSFEYIDIDGMLEEKAEVFMLEAEKSGELDEMMLMFMTEEGLDEEEAEEAVLGEFVAMASEEEEIQEEMRDMASSSILATVAQPFTVIFEPLGFGDWRLAAAAITGFIAKENVVGTLAVVYGVVNFIDTEEFELAEDEEGANEVANLMGLSSVAALAYLMFNLFTPPCFAAIGAMNAEMQNKKWLLGGIGLQFAVGYVVAFFVYQGGSVLTGNGIGDGFVIGAVIVAGIFAVIGTLIKKGGTNAEDYKLSSNTTTSV